MKPLIAYAATKNVFPDLERTLQIQEQYYADAWAHYDKVVAGDYFGWLPSVKADCWNGADLCLSRMRNAAIEHAKERGYKWLLLLDVDHVVLNSPEQMPSSGFGAPRIAWGEAEEPPFRLEDPKRWMPSQWWTLGEQHFDRRFCEEYTGYGFEEVDFQRHVMSDVPVTETNIRLVHLFHPRRADRWSNWELYERRKREHETRDQNVIEA